MSRLADGKRRFSITNFFRRTTPKPLDRQVFNPGIQEKDTSYLITSPIVYHIAHQSVIVRTCTTQLKNEIFRRGYYWDEKFASKCRECDYEHKSPSEECEECGSMNLAKPDRKQLVYAEKFLDGYVNKAEQMFIDILKEMEDDLNIMDDAYLVLVKEYYLDGSGGVCADGFELAPQSVLNFIASDFIGLTYYGTMSSNCCIWHLDQDIDFCIQLLLLN